MELTVETRGPVFQCTEMAGDVSEFFVAEAQSSQGHVLMGCDDANGKSKKLGREKIATARACVSAILSRHLSQGDLTGNLPKKGFSSGTTIFDSIFFPMLMRGSVE